MKTGVSSYSFSRYLNSGQEDIFGVIRMAAELGFDGIEFSGLKMPPGEKDVVSLAGRVRVACAEAGLPIISYTIPADFLQPSCGGDWEAEAERLKGEVNIAAALGVTCMRHDATRGFPEEHEGPSDFAAALPVLARGCRKVTEYAAGLGIKTTVENHGFFVQESERCSALMDAVDHPNFGALVDVGNFLCADEDPVSAVTRMAPYAFHSHVKDFHIKPAEADPGQGWFRSRGGNWLRGSIIGHGNVDVPSCIRALRSAGYDGFISIEFEGMEDNRRALEVGLENLRRYIAG